MKVNKGQHAKMVMMIYPECIPFQDSRREVFVMIEMQSRGQNFSRNRYLVVSQVCKRSLDAQKKGLNRTSLGIHPPIITS